MNSEADNQAEKTENEKLSPRTYSDQDLKQRKAALLSLMAETGMEFAAIIALPLLFFIFSPQMAAFVGFDSGAAWMRYHMEHASWYPPVGILSALALSAAAIYKRIKRINDFLK